VDQVAKYRRERRLKISSSFDIQNAVWNSEFAGAAPVNERNRQAAFYEMKRHRSAHDAGTQYNCVGTSHGKGASK
jgi:hypothetical protein